MLNKRDENEIRFTLENSGDVSVPGTYRIVITPSSTTGSEDAIYDKTKKIQKLKPGATKDIKLALNKSPVFKKLKGQGLYNIELYINERFVGSNMLSITDNASESATVRVWSSADGSQLARGSSIAMTAEVTGALPKGGYVNFAIATKDKNGNISYWYPGDSQVIPKRFSGKMKVFMTVPYDFTPYGSYTSGDEHYALASLYSGMQGVGAPINEAAAPAWFFTR